MNDKIRKIGVFTSGGDSPGMNAAVRAVVRAANYYGIECFGIYHGYEGMIDGNISPLGTDDVSNILQRGGTILRSARSKGFMTAEGRKEAYEHLKSMEIDALVAIGGDGTFTGGQVFTAEYPDIKFIGLPGTIDNDLFGTDLTIGYDTAVNTAVEAIDKIKDTAASHDRLFFVELMGRDAGFISLRSGIATGADSILIPEFPTDLNDLVTKLKDRKARGKLSSIVIVSEGDDAGGAYQIVDKIKGDLPDFEIKVSVLGHMQRGGSPSASDRVLASRMGVAAIDALRNGENKVMIGLQGKDLVSVPLEQATKHHNCIEPRLYKLAEILGS